MLPNSIGSHAVECGEKRCRGAIRTQHPFHLEGEALDGKGGVARSVKIIERLPE